MIAPMNNLLTEEAAETLLAPHLPAIGNCLREAVGRFKADRALTGPVSTRTRASNVHDYATEAAERIFDGVPGIELARDHGFLVIVVEDTAVIRFKKLTDRLATHGIATRQARLWDAQEPIPGLPQRTHLVAGYVLDDLGEIQRLALVCSRYGRVLWSIDLSGGHSEGTGTIMFPSLNDGPEPEGATVHSALKPEEADEQT